MMPRNQFARILRAFRIVDNESLPAKDHPNYRPSLRLWPLLDYIDVICMYYMDPGQNDAIDESLVAGKTRTQSGSTSPINITQDGELRFCYWPTVQQVTC